MATASKYRSLIFRYAFQPLTLNPHNGISKLTLIIRQLYPYKILIRLPDAAVVEREPHCCFPIFAAVSNADVITQRRLNASDILISKKNKR